MAERWTSRCRSCPTPAVAGSTFAASVLILLALLGSRVDAQDDAPTLALRSRSMQPGELVVATVVAPASITSVNITALGTLWPAFQMKDGTWQALIGIDLDTHPGQYRVEARLAGGSSADVGTTMTVVPKRFRRRTLRVSPEFVNPPPEIQDRIVREAALLRDIYAVVSSEPGWRDGFVRPVPNAANSAFGTRSVFNGNARSPHAGTDFLSPAGTPIHAPAAGRAVVARELFFTGNTVIIDHGLGVFSMLAHLSRIDVAEGQSIATGETIGLVGATGRVTGPHLHWALRIGAARVDALSALALLGNSR
ncbi:MAG: M23 family metallopeptidase [Vicinamibacterales bacterium]